MKNVWLQNILYKEDTEEYTTLRQAFLFLGQLGEFPEKHFLGLFLFQLTSGKRTDISHCFHFTMSLALDIYNAGQIL